MRVAGATCCLIWGDETPKFKRREKNEHTRDGVRLRSGSDYDTKDYFGIFSEQKFFSVSWGSLSFWYFVEFLKQEDSEKSMKRKCGV